MICEHVRGVTQPGLTLSSFMLSKAGRNLNSKNPLLEASPSPSLPPPSSVPPKVLALLSCPLNEERQDGLVSTFACESSDPQKDSGSRFSPGTSSSHVEWILPWLLQTQGGILCFQASLLIPGASDCVKDMSSIFRRQIPWYPLQFHSGMWMGRSYYSSVWQVFWPKVLK